MICLLDISGFIYKAYYSMPHLKHNNQEVGAVFGFCSEILNIIEKFPKATFVAAMDCSRDTFRRKIYPQYKANRKNMPQELLNQCNLIKECCENFGFNLVQALGFEADDIIASFAAYYNNKEEVIVISADKDLLQLLKLKSIKVYNPNKKVFLNKDYVINKFGVLPEQLLDLFALTGDVSDNVPGVKGIGPKTAAKLIKTFNNLEYILNNVNAIDNINLKKKLVTEKAKAELSKQLIDLRYDLNINYNIKKQSFNNIQNLFNFLGFKKLNLKLKKLLVAEI